MDGNAQSRPADRGQQCDEIKNLLFILISILKIYILFWGGLFNFCKSVVFKHLYICREKRPRAAARPPVRSSARPPVRPSVHMH
jgi:hypothetical protein